MPTSAFKAQNPFRWVRRAVRTIIINNNIKDKTKNKVKDQKMATGAADGFFRCLYEGSISGYDNGIERRPYHRNCGCALHGKSGNKKSCTHKFRCNVSYPIRRSWSEGSLTLMASASSSPSSSPATAAINGIGFVSCRSHSGLADLAEEEENN